ncbi:MAG: GNAT family N-acetyltransferase [Clostridia bacterium]|nr:GNAT family N-acetyltransferase [Clostridia bacterium]
MPDITYGRGTHEQFDDYIDFINYVFGFNGSDSDFIKLLPKLYRPELDPAYHSFSAVEDGKFKAAIGTFPSEQTVCGITLRCVGIGNVAVHPRARGEGYMRKLMEMAIDDMVAQGADFSALGGRRQRYNYFSYDRAGTQLSFTVNNDNVRHTFGKTPIPFKAAPVHADDAAALDAIAALSAAQSYAPIRDRAELYAILTSWRARPWIVTDGDRFVGYAVLNGDNITEILAVDEADFIGMLRTLYAVHGRSSISVKLPVWQTAYIRALEPIAESTTVGCPEMFSVLCYRRVIEAFLRLKATYATLPDGELTALIHGRGGDEQLRIAVKDAQITVEPTDKTPDLELNHLEAMNYFFAPTCTARLTAPMHVQMWLPLPIWLYNADAV